MSLKCYLLFFVFLTFVSSKEEYILWSASQKLTWEDFKGEADSNNTAVALS